MKPCQQKNSTDVDADEMARSATSTAHVGLELVHRLVKVGLVEASTSRVNSTQLESAKVISSRVRCIPVDCTAQKLAGDPKLSSQV